MNIAIIGSGHIGAGLARPWIQKGHSVSFGAREPQSPALLTLCKSIGATSATIEAAARSATVVVLAMPYAALDDVLRATGELDGKLVIDCTNAVERGMVLKYGHTTSAAEELQQRLPQAHVFKSFNAQGAENLAHPHYGDVAASNFFCGDDAQSRAAVRELVEAVGFEAVDAGPLKSARYLEPMMVLWVTLAQSLGTRDLAFKLLQR